MAEAEKQPHTGDDILASLRDYHAPRLPTPQDALNERFTVQFNQPQPAFSNEFVTSYTATDSENPAAILNAAVFKGLPPRTYKTIHIFTQIRHPNLLSVLEEGSVAIGNTQERHYAIISERPTGPSLLEIMRQNDTNIPESVLIHKVITPIAEIIKAMQLKGTRHGRIHVSNLFLIDGNMMLGEGVTTPPGFSLPFTSDSIEQLLASPEFKGENNVSADCYALGTLAMQLLVGAKPLTKLTREEYIEKIFSHGSYATLAEAFDFSPNMQDFFRGVFQENAPARWDPDTILRWAAGKRFHILNPPAAVESSRAFIFADKSYWNCRSLANAIEKNWSKAKELFESDKLVRWAEASLRKSEASDVISRVILRTGGGQGRTIKNYDEAVTRLIMALDPTGPIRFMGLSFRYDSIGEVLAKAVRDNQTEAIQVITKMIDSDFLSSLSEILKDKAPPDLEATVKSIHKIRPFLRSTVFGSGPERALYDINPDLPCQSTRLVSYHITDLSDMLLVLDSLASRLAANEDVLDRQSAAFISSKLAFRGDPRVPTLIELPSLASDPHMISLYLIMNAARKTQQTNLPGLAHWLAVRIAPLFDQVHNRKVRDSMRTQFINTSKSGNIEALAQLVFDPDMLSRDERNFRNVDAWYKNLGEQIAYYSHPEVHKFHATRLSQWFAQAVSATTCGTVVYGTLKYYMHL